MRAGKWTEGTKDNGYEQGSQAKMEMGEYSVGRIYNKRRGLI